MRKSVAYFEGTDSTLLTSLICEGHDTIPVSNGRDSHGPHVRLINDQNRYDLLIGYMHKIFAPEDQHPGDATFQDVFHLCRTYSIPLLVEVPTELHDKAREILQNPPEIVHLVDPSETLSVATRLLAHGEQNP